MKLFNKVKRAVANFLRPTVREAMRDFDVLKAKLERVADGARAEAGAVKAEVEELFSKIDSLKAKGTECLDEAARASRVAARINELLK
jgi:hypothetical protein